ncbi:hypothetical protein GCM10010965_21070 [Caldalkalibacillus thermarum]|uniref:YfhH family protein n=1 Tax=Caldalkalibacillus thermarum TaxID=296745 RepID=UPI0016694C20|nr:YfhH family protein [Caldalkalibacillus thermarum]GGK27992.1 hypothetical protein GCM10010965_21070 [Caldalkalibacillus thermarum]
MTRMSDMSREELEREMQRLLAEARKKEQAGFISEANVLEQKFYMAKSYLMDPAEIKIGGKYRVAGEEGIFTVEYLNGVFAWGKLDTSPEKRGFPIGRLKEIKN